MRVDRKPLLLGLILPACLPLLAQEFRAQISGTVIDPSGSAIAGATIIAVNLDTNLRASASSGPTGGYLLLQLPPGRYELTAEAPGFRRYSRQGIVLNVADKATVDVRLELGTLTESVQVSAELTGIETNQSVLGQVMNNRSITELPLNGRSVFMLMQFSSGVIWTGQRFGADGLSGTRAFNVEMSTNLTFHGGLPGSSAFLLDGAPLGVGGGGAQFVPLVDGVDEFKVTAPSSDASYGLSGAGVINIAMKGGTNAFHGTLSEYVRNHIFDAVTTQTKRAAAQNPAFQTQQHQWNDFSALFTGPIKRDKFFFSGWYEGFRERNPQPVTVTLPTVRQRAGDFSQTRNAAGQTIIIQDPLTTQQEGARFVRTAFLNNTVPPFRMNAIARNILPFVPLPNTVTNSITETNNYVSTPNVARYAYDAWFSKFDYAWSSYHRTSASVTENWGTERRSNNGIPSGPALSGQDPLRRDHYGATLDHVWTMSPSTVFNARASWGRYINHRGMDIIDAFDGSSLGWKSPIGADPKIRFPLLNFSGEYAELGNNFRFFPPDNNYTLSAEISRTMGRHFLKVGGAASEYRRNRINTSNRNGSFIYNREFTQRDPQRPDTDSGNSFAAFLLGYPASGSTEINPEASFRSRAYGLFIQDDFKVNSRLTLNFGIRWDVQTPLTEVYDRMAAGFDPNVTYRLGNAQARGGFLFAGPEKRTAWTTNYRDFQPRFGLAYRITPKLVTRASYGLSALPIGGAGGITIPGGRTPSRQEGFSRTTPYVATVGGGADSFIPNRPGASTWETPYPNGILQPFGTSLGPLTQVGQGLAFDAAGYLVPRVHQFHFGFAYDLPWNTTAEISYVASRTRRLPQDKDVSAISLEERLRGVADPNYLNAAVSNPFVGAPELAGTGLATPTIRRAQAIRPFPQFTAVIQQRTPIGTQTADLLETRLQKRFSDGLMFIGSYTFGKILQSRGFLEPQYDFQYRTLADYDRPHHLATTFLFELPIGRGKRLASGAGPVLHGFLGGWQINSTLEWQIGTPTAAPVATALRNPELPDGQQSYQKWFDTCTLLASGARANCSSPDAPITWQQLRPNELRVTDDRFPGIRNQWVTLINASAIKNFKIRERYALQFRAEVFHLLNSPNYAGPNINITSPLFGVVVQDQQNFPRSMQFALRLSF